MFGKTSFNRTQFNLTAPFLSLYVNMRANYDTSFSRLSALVDIGNSNLSSRFDTESGQLFAKVPLSGTDIESEFDVESGNLAVMVPLGGTDINSAFEFIAPSLKNDVTEEFSLENVLLAPGDTMIVDTDKLEIQVNDVNLLESWVSGGVFFLLKPGSNTIQFDTNPSSCELTITIFWADRYL